MTKYRILEKEGAYTSPKQIAKDKGQSDYNSYTDQLNVYIPRFIVQVYNSGFPENELHLEWKDLKEFTSLEEAREYKRKLELKEGIVVE